jgi:hypothetical protein
VIFLKKGKIFKKSEIERKFAPKTNADMNSGVACFHAVLMSIEDFMA